MRPQGVAPAAQYQEVAPEPLPQPGQRLPPSSLSGELVEGQPRTLRQAAPQVEMYESASPEVYYDQGMSGGMHGMMGGYENYGNNNCWGPPVLPVLGNMSLSVRAEFLYWWTNASHTPILATSSPANVDVDEAGVLGEPGTNVLFGGNVNDDIRPGARFTADLWFDCCQSHGLEVSYLFLSTETTNYSVNSDRVPVIARPFLNAETGLQDSALIAYPGLLEGALAIETSTSFHMGDIAYRRNILRDHCRSLDLLVGYRYAYLNDELRIRDTLTSIDAASGVPLGTTISTRDNFEATSSFNGLLLGINFQRATMIGCVDLWAKTALGNTNLETNISGSSLTTVNGVSTTDNSGFLALPTNIGRRESDEFSSINELGIRLNRDIGCWRASVGYNVLLWSSIGRAGDIVDTTVNTSQLPPGPLVGQPAPRYRENKSSFWAQGVTFGLERCW
jgi:hypothetical protein